MQHKIVYSIAFYCMLGWSSYVTAQKANSHSTKILIPNEDRESYVDGNMRIEKATGVPRAIYQANYAVTPGDPVTMAMEYLRNHAEVLGLKPDLSDLAPLATRETPGGFHVRFTQHCADLPVFRGEVTVTIDRNNVVTFVANGYQKDLVLDNVAATISAQDAIDRANSHLNVQGKINLAKTEPIVYANNGVARLAFKTTLVPAEDQIGDWEILIDAKSGEVFRAEDKALHYRDRGRAASPAATGTAQIFDPDPMSRSHATYGAGGFVDNNDANSSDLANAQVTVTLPDLTLQNGQYQLKGPYAEIVDSEAPLKGTFSQAANSWSYTRDADAFEAANVYYHIDKSMRYINVTLGVPLMPFQYAGGVKADPHGLNGDDNSHYLPSTGQLAFGEGGIDDAEDLDVILHELGHGLHDWASNGQISQVDGLSEGCGDYWAASYMRSLGYWQPSDSEYNWVFHWDGHNEYWAGRVVNYNALYPSGRVGQIHTDGQIWSSTLMSIWNSIGRTATDQDFLECLSMLNSTSSQNDAANAFYQADAALHGGTYQATILSWLQQRGYTINTGTPPSAPSNLAATASSNSQINLTWTDNAANEIGFYLERKTGATGTYAQIASVGANVVSYSNTGLSVGTTYYYRVRAYNSSGISSYSNEANATTLSGTPPNAPSSLTATAASWSQINLAWRDNSSNETGFYIERKTGVGGTYVQIGSVGAGVKSYSNTGLIAGTTYYYRVRAYNGGGNSAYSNEANATTPGSSDNLALGKMATATSTYSSNTSNKTVDASTSTYWSSAKLSSSNKLQYLTVNLGAALTVSKVVVKWNSTNFAKIYTIQVSSTGTTFTTVYTDNAGNGGDDACIFTATTAQYVRLEMSAFNKTYYQAKELEIYASATKADDIAAGETGVTTGPDEIVLQPNYPNPFNPSTTIAFSLPERMHVTLKIFNVAGQEAVTLVDGELEYGMHQIVFDASGLTSGIYFAVLQAGEQRQVRRLTLMK